MCHQQLLEPKNSIFGNMDVLPPGGRPSPESGKAINPVPATPCPHMHVTPGPWPPPVRPEGMTPAHLRCLRRASPHSAVSGLPLSAIHTVAPSTRWPWPPRVEGLGIPYPGLRVTCSTVPSCLWGRNTKTLDMHRSSPEFFDPKICTVSSQSHPTGALLSRGSREKLPERWPPRGRSATAPPGWSRQTSRCSGRGLGGPGVVGAGGPVVFRRRWA